MRLLRGSSVMVAALLLVSARQAQPPSPPQQPPTFRAGTNIVRVDVTVIGHNGQPVTDLTKDDFTVAEDGAPQRIETFKLVEATGRQTEGDELSLPIRSRDHAAAEAAKDEVRVFVIFWNEYRIDRMASASRAREMLAQLVQTAFGPTDLVAIVDPLTPSDAIQLTRDRGDLAEQIRRLPGRLGVYIPPRGDMEASQVDASLGNPRALERLRTQVTETAIEATVGFLGTIKEGRKELLFVTEPFFGSYDWLERIVRLANSNNTAIYVYDPRGVGMGSSMLTSLAEDTGGRQIRTNSPIAQLTQMVTDASAFYLLGYPSQAPYDGKFHKIAVHLNRKGVEIRARSGYYTPTLAEMNREKERTTAAELPKPVEKALSALVPTPSDAAGEFWAGAEPAAGGLAHVKLAWTPRAAADKRTVTAHVTGSDGHVYFDGALPANGAAFEAPPGALKIQHAVIAPDGSAEDSQTMALEVPDFAATPLAISSPIVMRARTGIEARTLRSSTDPQPFAGREFERTDLLIVRFAVAGTSASEAKVEVNLLDRTAKVRASLPFAPVAAAPGSYELEFPLGSVTTGEYIISIGATAGDRHVEALVPFKAR